MIAELIMSSTVYEDLLSKVNRGRTFYDKLDAKVKQLLERSHRVCKTEREERSRIQDRLAPKGIRVCRSMNCTSAIAFCFKKFPHVFLYYLLRSSVAMRRNLVR